jgi:hypothetical protein
MNSGGNSANNKSGNAQRSSGPPTTLDDVISKLMRNAGWADRTTKLFDDITESWLSAFQAGLVEVAERILESMQPFVTIAEILQELEERFRVAEAEATQVLRRYKWFISPSMPASLLFEVVKLERRGGNQRGAINRLFVEYFSADNYAELAQLVKSWRVNPLFGPRMKTLRDCVAVLKGAEGRYNPSNVVLPTLIAQIDGILTDYLQQTGIGRADREEWKRWKEQFKSHTADQYLPDLANEVILDLLFQRALPGQPLATPFTFSRHKIMHGEYTRYGRIDNAIRAILILDFLSQL